MRALALACLTVLGTAGAASYTVRAGDTLYSLARASGVRVADLQRLNGLRGAARRPGQQLTLPDAQPPLTVQAIPALPPTVSPTAAVFQRGMAVYYPGRRDARTPMTAAHLTLPKGSWVRVTHLQSGRSVTVLINDRGPFGNRARVIDLSQAAARELGILGQGVAAVTLTRVERP